MIDRSLLPGLPYDCLQEVGQISPSVSEQDTDKIEVLLNEPGGVLCSVYYIFNLFKNPVRSEDCRVPCIGEETETQLVFKAASNKMRF